MSATLKILSQFTITAQGQTFADHQGTYDSATDDYLEITVSGLVFAAVGQVATATVRTLWDEDNQFPADFDYLWFWCDQDVYLQIIGQTGNVTLKVEATVPLWLPGFDQLLVAANTTLITGGSEPAVEDVDSVAVGNYSGNTANYKLYLFD